jgi:uncharacterized protein (TIGR02246 family)
MKKSLSAVVLVLALATPAFAQNAGAIADEWNQKWLQAYNKGDAAALTALYTKDAVLVRPKAAEPIVGEANIRKHYDQEVQNRAKNLTITSTETQMFDPNTVIDAGTWSGDIPGEKGGASVHIAGTYAETFVHHGSDWLLRTDAAAMMPPPPTK